MSTPVCLACGDTFDEDASTEWMLDAGWVQINDRPKRLIATDQVRERWLCANRCWKVLEP